MSLRAAAACAILLSACKPSAPSSSVADAGSDGAAAAPAVEAGPIAAARDRTLVPVAEGAPEVRLWPTLDGRIVLVSGSIPYEAKASGVLEPLATPAGLAPLFPDDDVFVGFLEPSLDVQWVRGSVGGPEPLFLDGWAGTRKTLALANGRLTNAPIVDGRHVVRWRGRLLGARESRAASIGWLDGKNDDAAAPVVPAKMRFVDGLAVDASGALVVLSASFHEPARAAIYDAAWKSGDPPSAIIEAKDDEHCQFVTTFDRSALVRCAKRGAAVAYLRPTRGGFERVFENAPPDAGASSVGADGALYVTSSKQLSVTRCPAEKGAACTSIDVSADGASLDSAYYEPSVTDVVERDGSRSWTSLRIEKATSHEPLAAGASIVARSQDDVWLVARAGGRALVLHSTDDPRRERMRLRTPLDARVIAKNASPPQPWTGHCEQVFVRMPAADAKRFAEIEKAVGSKPLSYEHAFQWWVVEGRLHEDRVAGVVVARRDAEEPLEKMERAVERLVAAFSPNPMSHPTAYCTLPVLHRRLYPND